MPTINLPKKKRRIPTISVSDINPNYYHSKDWQWLRNDYYMEHPLCERCLMDGRSVPAEEVHHKVPFLTGKTVEERWMLLLDRNNLMSLCKDCHHAIHNERRKAQMNKKF